MVLLQNTQMKIEHITAKEYQTFFKKQKEPKKNKYNAIKTEVGEKKFDSQSEGNFYWELMMQERQGIIQEVICQAKEELWAYGKHIFNYYVDFKVIHNDGIIEFIEHKSKGTVTDLWRAKWKMLEAKYSNEINGGKVKCSINWYQGGYKIINQKK